MNDLKNYVGGKVKHQEYQLNTQDGLRLYAQAWLSEKPAKALVVIVHGIGEHSGRYEHVAQAFTENGFHTFSYDQRGHGRSDGKIGHTPTYQHLMDDISLAIQYARQATSEDLPVFLYGLSLGALEVIFYGLQKPNQVKGTIATGLPIDLSETSKVKILIGRLMNPLMPTFTMANGLDVNVLSRDAQVVKAYVDDPLVHDRVTARLGMFLIDGAQQVLEQASAWHSPLLLMHGSEDRLSGIRGAEQFAEKASGGVTYKRWEGFYHEIHNEPQKAEVVQTMVDWISQQL